MSGLKYSIQLDDNIYKIFENYEELRTNLYSDIFYLIQKNNDFNCYVKKQGNVVYITGTLKFSPVIHERLLHTLTIDSRNFI